MALLRASYPVSGKATALVCGGDCGKSDYFLSPCPAPLITTATGSCLCYLPDLCPQPSLGHLTAPCPTPNCSTRNSLPKPAENKAGINPPPHRMVHSTLHDPYDEIHPFLCQHSTFNAMFTLAEEKGQKTAKFGKCKTAYLWTNNAKS